MTPGLLLDAGPLVALLNRRDRHHAWARKLASRRRPPFVTCEAVISEACFLLRELDGGADAVLALGERELVKTPFRLSEEAVAARKLMARYASVPMSFADACLVRLAEAHPEVPLATMDGAFRIYRTSNRRVIPVLMPDRK